MLSRLDNTNILVDETLTESVKNIGLPTEVNGANIDTVRRQLESVDPNVVVTVKEDVVEVKRALKG